MLIILHLLKYVYCILFILNKECRLKTPWPMWDSNPGRSRLHGKRTLKVKLLSQLVTRHLVAIY